MRKLPETMCYCIQGLDQISGETGSFAYDTERYLKEHRFYAISPVFGSLVGFYPWAKSRGYKSKPNTYELVMVKEN
jgi:hypothetical protein